MTAAQVAEALKARDIQVRKVTEGGHNRDGGVWITDRICVGVGFYEEKIHLAAMLDGGIIKFYQDRPASDIDGIVNDILCEIKAPAGAA